MKLHGSDLPISALTDGDFRRMLDLMWMHYDNVQHEKFSYDLAQKKGAILLRDDNGVIQGFTTYLIDSLRYESEDICLLFSGDTIVNEICWGQKELVKLFGMLMRRVLADHGGGKKIYWSLISKGYRTYLYLPLYFKQYYPHYEYVLERERGITSQYMAHRYGQQYDPNSNIIRHHPPADKLKAQLCQVPHNKQTNPHVRYFIQQNPAYWNGDELACLAEVGYHNMTSIARRIMDRICAL